MALLQLLSSSTGERAIPLILPLGNLAIHFVEEVVLNCQHGAIRCDVPLRKRFALWCVLVGSTNANVSLTILRHMYQRATNTPETFFNISTPAHDSNPWSWLDCDHDSRVVAQICYIRPESLTLCHSQVGIPLLGIVVQAIKVEMHDLANKAILG
jgi:hypothetical protein